MSNHNDVAQRERNIRAIISQQPRRVVPGCLIKIETQKMFGAGSDITLHCPYLYGIVGLVIDYCHSTTAIGYQVDFAVHYITIPYNVWALTQPIFENDMILLGFPNESLSVDDALIGELFFMQYGIWYKKQSRYQMSTK